jgi:Flp pilus assembly protein TadD
VLLVTGKASEAATEFRVVVGLTPEAAEAHANLGMALAGAGRREEAIGELEKALKLQPGFAAAEQELRVLKERTP